jgi:hypothetical protein
LEYLLSACLKAEAVHLRRLHLLFVYTILMPLPLQGELMTGSVGYRNTSSRVSQITLALLEDSGWYVPR